MASHIRANSAQNSRLASCSNTAVILSESPPIYSHRVAKPNGAYNPYPRGTLITLSVGVYQLATGSSVICRLLILTFLGISYDSLIQISRSVALPQAYRSAAR